MKTNRSCGSPASGNRGGDEKGENMDTNILLQRFEYLKFSKDRISKCPDFILNSILSHLPTKDAIRTSVLSTRWQHIWTSLSHIDLNGLDNSSTYDGASSFNFVERVLLLHDSSNIKSFHLGFFKHVDPSRVHSWLSAILKHNIEEIVLRLTNISGFPLPCCLFTCQSLVVLKIATCAVLKVPTVVRFPHLKTLDLSNVLLLNDDSIERLLSNCPLLQDLVLACSWENIYRVTVSIPSLKRFSFVPVTRSSDYAEDCTITIDAPNLVFLQYNSNFRFDCILNNLPSSVNATISIKNLRCVVLDRVLHLLNCVQNVQSLSVFGVENMQAVCLAEHVSTFNMLTTLRLDLEIWKLEIYGSLMDFLQTAPILEFLEIDNQDVDYLYDDIVFGEDQEMNVVPRCFESHLKTISITLYNANEIEMHLLKLLLKHTAVLERMIIYVVKGWEDSAQLERLQMFPRASDRCVFKILESYCVYRKICGMCN